MLFFFQSPSPNRDLHSFPTRRSSDLVRVEEPEQMPHDPLVPLARRRRHEQLAVDQFVPRRVARDAVAERRSEEHTSELQSRFDLVCRLLLEKKKKNR